MNPKAKLALDWTKAHWLIVLFVVIFFSAPVAGWVFSSSWNESVVKEIKKRIVDYDKLEKVKKTSIEGDFFGESTREILVNKDFVDRYQAAVNEVKSDVELLESYATRFNKNENLSTGAVSGTTLKVVDGFESGGVRQVFPIFGNPGRRTALPGEFRKALIDEMISYYNGLYAESSFQSGQSPVPNDVLAGLTEKASAFLSRTSGRTMDEALDEDQTVQLLEYMTKERIDLYRSRAQGAPFYLLFESLLPPLPAPQATEGELFVSQWKWWIIRELVEAIRNINSGIVESAPVKHLISFEVLDLPQPQELVEDSKQGNSGRPRGARNSDSNKKKITGGKYDPGKLAPVDFKESLTGRFTNPLWDVITVKVKLIVETDQMVNLIDGFARQNFISVLDMGMRPVDSFSALDLGYVYGARPVSEAEFTLETIWLRSWIVEMMPDSVKRALKIDISKLNNSSGRPR